MANDTSLANWLALLTSAIMAEGPERDAAVLTAGIPDLNDADRNALADAVLEIDTTKKAMRARIANCIKAQPLRAVVESVLKDYIKPDTVYKVGAGHIKARAWAEAANGVTEPAQLVAALQRYAPTIEQDAANIADTAKHLEHISKHRGFADPVVERLFLIIYDAVCHGVPMQSNLVDLLNE